MSEEKFCVTSIWACCRSRENHPEGDGFQENDDDNLFVLNHPSDILKMAKGKGKGMEYGK
jgi:hypothetical protein